MTRGSGVITGMQFGVFSVGDVTPDPTNGTAPTELDRLQAMATNDAVKVAEDFGVLQNLSGGLAGPVPHPAARIPPRAAPAGQRAGESLRRTARLGATPEPAAAMRLEH